MQLCDGERQILRTRRIQDPEPSQDVADDFRLIDRGRNAFEAERQVQARDDKNWEEAKGRLKNVGGFSIDIVKQVLQQIILERLGLR